MEQILQENKNKQIKEELTNAEKREIKREAKEIIEKQTKENIKTNVVKPTLSYEEKISNFFNKIEFLSLTNEQKEFTAKKIKKDSTGDKLYWIMIFLSSTIAAL